MTLLIDTLCDRKYCVELIAIPSGYSNGIWRHTQVLRESMEESTNNNSWDETANIGIFSF